MGEPIWTIECWVDDRVFRFVALKNEEEEGKKNARKKNT